MSSIIVLSSLDTDRWGVVTAKASDVTGERVAGVLDEARGRAVKLLIVRCPTTDVDAAHALEHAGAEIMDTLITYTRTTADVPPRPDVVFVRTADDRDVAGIRELARTAFVGYRGHYHADPRLDRDRCNDVYVDWAERSCTDRNVAEEVLVAELDGRPVGFATLHQGEGVLFGVSPDARGRGVYAALMIHGLERCRARGQSRMTVSTQLTNLAVQKVWVRLGFEPAASRYTFHVWLA